MNYENGYVYYLCACVYENGYGSVYGCVYDYDYRVSVYVLLINNNIIIYIVCFLKFSNLIDLERIYFIDWF